MGDEIMEEVKFKNYKEKQAYYKNRARQENMIWVSKEPNFSKNKNTIIKGRTYVKPKENENDTNK